MKLTLIIAILIVRFSYSQEIIKNGNFRVLYPTKTEKLEIEIIDKTTSKSLEIKEKGNYVLVSEKNEKYKISFEVNNDKKVSGNIIISNYRLGDSTIIKQEKLKFISEKTYRNKILFREFTYERDSVFSYKDYFSNAYYIGKTRLTKFGYFNIEHKEYDSINKLKINNYLKDNIYYEEEYAEEKLIKKKYIQNNENTIIFYENNFFKIKEVYKEIDGDYFIYCYDKNDIVVDKKLIDSSQFEKEFSILDARIK